MYQFVIKRTLDLFFSMILFLLLVIVIPFVWILIFLDDRGPLFYKAPRLGRNMEKIQMYKFRTMKVDAPDIRNNDGSTFNSANDNRVTKIGAFLRKSSIDELPQIINVVKGDMSFIGPRPSPLGNESLYSEEYLQKFNVKPGITGLNQALLRNSSTMDQRIENDVKYSKNISFSMDLKILYLTLFTVVRSKNINRNASSN